MKKVLIIILIIIAIISGIVLTTKFTKEGENTELNNVQVNNVEEQEEKVEEQKKIEIFKGNDRPIAVMIDNVGDARPQAGLNDAYMVYEITVEGKLTRLMALFKNVDLEKLGPVRSARHYFIDYVLENDAIYTHFGCSIIAEQHLKDLNIDHIDGMVESSKTFWRVSDKAAPHNVATSTEKLLKVANRKGYRTTSDKDSVLNYVSSNIELENGISATEVSIPYTSTYKVSYKYDENTKRYTRAYNGTTHKDWKTKENVTTKNIIITFAKNYTISEYEEADLQELENIGSLDGYYITNGKAIKIKCEKSSRKEQTVYKDLEGNEIKVNDGNTFIQIVPIDTQVGVK